MAQQNKRFLVCPGVTQDARAVRPQDGLPETTHSSQSRSRVLFRIERFLEAGTE